MSPRPGSRSGHRHLHRSLAALLSISIAACSQGTATPVGANVTVSVSPAAISVTAREAQQFTATVRGTADTAVAWSVGEGVVAGGIEGSGRYVASQTAGVYHVRATAHADPSVSGYATVTVVPAAGSPTIASFVATPSAITAGQSTTRSGP